MAKLKRATQPQCHAIAEWLRTNKEAILAASPRASRADVLAEAIKALGFDISPSTFETQTKLAGITWQAPRGPGRMNTSEIARSCAAFCKLVSERLGIPLPSKLNQYNAYEDARKKKYPKQ